LVFRAPAKRAHLSKMCLTAGLSCISHCVNLFGHNLFGLEQRFNSAPCWKATHIPRWWYTQILFHMASRDEVLCTKQCEFDITTIFSSYYVFNSWTVKVIRSIIQLHKQTKHVQNNSNIVCYICWNTKVHTYTGNCYNAYLITIAQFSLISSLDIL